MPLDPSDVPTPHIVPTATMPLVHELDPAPDPWELINHFGHQANILFLDSADRDSPLGRFSYVAAESRGGIGSHRSVAEDSLANLAGDDYLLRQASFRAVPDLPPFQGGIAGLFGYEFCHELETIPRPRHDEFNLPHMLVRRYDWLISFDHRQGRAWVVSNAPTVDTAAAQIQAVREAVSRPARRPRARPYYHGRIAPLARHRLPGYPGVVSNFDRAGYEAAVRRVVEYIRAGDCYQVNLSQRLLAPLTGHPRDLYGRLRERNPAPFGAYFESGYFAIASASPERFLKVTAAGDVETRPIKGTRPRGRTPAEDEANRRELLASAKDRAENVMIVDLMRNDLGRVCKYGSVDVTKLCELESYRTVHHLVSEVVGKLRPGMTAFDLLRAAFPGGSVTGAPKVRAMEIIAELEPTARGPYCGSLGYIGFDGAMDTNILIRTFTLGRGWAQFPVGGGIVADSDPAAEYEETLHKAAGLLRALE
jgi:para-aminobenzoate synthetase component 1